MRLAKLGFKAFFIIFQKMFYTKRIQAINLFVRGFSMKVKFQEMEVAEHPVIEEFLSCVCRNHFMSLPVFDVELSVQDCCALLSFCFKTHRDLQNSFLLPKVLWWTECSWGEAQRVLGCGLSQRWTSWPRLVLGCRSHGEAMDKHLQTLYLLVWVAKASGRVMSICFVFRKGQNPCRDSLFLWFP